MANKSKGNRHTTVIRLPVELYEDMARYAQEIGVSLNDYMVHLIRLGLRSSEKVQGHTVLRTAEQTASK